MLKGVVMLVNEFSPLPVGGAERQAERLSAHLARRGWQVWVITRRADSLLPVESRSGFQILRPSTFGPGKLQTILFVLGAIASLWQLRKEYSILHAHLAFGPAFAAVLVSRFLGKRVLIKLGNSGEFGDIHVSQKSWRGRLRLSILRRWADAVIVLDETMQAEALSAGFDPRRLYLIPNGIDVQSYIPRISRAQSQAALGLAGRVVVLSVGRLAAQKSLPVLIQAFASALPACPQLYLLVVGDGPERASLEALVHSLGIVDQVCFVGNQSDVRPYLFAADLFALPSVSEGISNALLEAMSAGIACMATPVGGSPEVLARGECGLLLPIGDVQAWGDALSALGQSAELRQAMGQAARARAQREYDIEVVGARYESFYGELLAQPNVPVKTVMGAKL